MAKEWARQFYNSKAWKDMRRYILKRDHYTCAHCQCRAAEIHHIKELTPDNIDDINISLNPDNLISLCRDCHAKITKGYTGDVRDGFIFDERGNVIPEIPPGGLV